MSQTRHPIIYDLYGVIGHRGDLHSGHYYAVTKNNLDQCWYLFDDDVVQKVTVEDCLTPDAFILFYQKRLDSRYEIKIIEN